MRNNTGIAKEKDLMVYALYDGETNVWDGTAKELSEKFGYKEKEISRMSSPAHRKRSGESGKFTIRLGKKSELGEITK